MNLITSTAPTMSSQEIADLVGSRHDKVKQSIERLVERGTISQPPMGDGPRSANGVVVQEYHVCKRDSFIVVAQLSPEFTAALVDRWQELEDGARPMTQAEITAANANHLVEMERQQREQQVAIDRIERRVEVIAEQRVWDHCPQNCIPLGRIQAEMNKTYGLSGPMVSFVLRQWPNQPNHAGMVRNVHEEAKGSQYIVWSKSLVTAAFKRFVSECQMVSATQATHPYFEGRFRLVHKVKS
ncbi:Rha family transcriptional regulator [Pseudomonas amygdali]|uniref:Phage related protein n=1 Tax=Pseudomonas amygdali pv. hibisci TaxID=251723 RepID=A0AB34U2A0_PSEA0|nr:MULTISPECIES: Rha family transcriptional regulator [Pseudomonas syringae group]KPX51902.1 putative phage related protein [Pseudomonas amygdali pv. hibisci]RMM56145.1 putative phage-related protein [Pseudomonas syringae pv. atrofaciens]RMN57774.1 putative phage related protein [Pseudomonas amygdali pv. hibisci]UBT81183.1 Rha family transcriptional regulator [Pseudomonas amygdali]